MDKKYVTSLKQNDVSLHTCWTRWTRSSGLFDNFTIFSLGSFVLILAWWTWRAGWSRRSRWS